MANRQIKLTKPIRADIVENVVAKWNANNPRPAMDRVPSPGQLSALHEWKEVRSGTARKVQAALETFSTFSQLEELWPAIVPFVPSWVLDPEKAIQLP